MGKDLKKTLPNPECELGFYPEELFFFFQDKTTVLWGKRLKVTH